MRLSISIYGCMVKINDVAHCVPDLKNLMPLIPIPKSEVTIVHFEDGIGQVEFDRPKQIRFTDLAAYRPVLEAWLKEHSAHEALLKNAKPADKEDAARITQMLNEADAAKSEVSTFLKG